MVEKTTLDHIPPRNLFLALPPNVIKVQSCKACNQGSSKDDEYFRLIATDSDLANQPDAKFASVAVARSLEREEAAGWRESVRQSCQTGLLETGSGVVVPKTFFGIDISRLEQSATKIIRGIYYHVAGAPVPKNSTLIVAHMDSFLTQPKHPGNVDLLRQLFIPKWVETIPYRIGDVFTYRVLRDKEDPAAMGILFEVYVKWQFFGIVFPRDESDHANT